MDKRNDQALEAAKIARMAATEMLAQGIQWRLDPRYIITLCDAVERAPAARPEADGLEVVGWAQDAALVELAKHKDATATIASGLLSSPFGSTVALVRLSDAQAAFQARDETIARLTAERDEALDDTKFAERIAAKREFDAVAEKEVAEARLSRAMEVVRLAEAELTKLYAAIAPHSDGRAADGSDAVRAVREFLEGGE